MLLVLRAPKGLHVVGTESTKGTTNTPMVFILDNGMDGDGNDELDQKKNQENFRCYLEI